MSRHRGHHGFGPFGRGFMEGGGMGGRGFGMGRKLASGDLQLLILKLLDEKSRYGYEIIKELEERSKLRKLLVSLGNVMKQTSPKARARRGTRTFITPSTS